MKFLGFLTAFQILFAANLSARTISGHVTKLGGSAVAGAKISAKDAPSIFTFSDSQGFYKLDLPQEIVAIEVSHSDFVTKTVNLQQLNVVNIVLVPSKYLKFRFGSGITYGNGNVLVYVENHLGTDTSVFIDLNSLSVDLGFYYRPFKHFEIDALLGNDFNFMKYTDSLGAQKTGVLNRLNSGITLNYFINLSKSGNYSLFLGAGPQYQRYSFFKSNVLGARYLFGISLNNYGFNTRIFFAGDIGNGIATSDEVKDFLFSYQSFKIGVMLLF